MLILWGHSAILHRERAVNKGEEQRLPFEKLDVVVVVVVL